MSLSWALENVAPTRPFWGLQPLVPAQVGHTLPETFLKEVFCTKNFQGFEDVSPLIQAGSSIGSGLTEPI